MPTELPGWIKGYWGIVEKAANANTGRGTGSGALFSILNAERSARGEAPLSGVTAIQMGQVYSRAVHHRNAAANFAQVYTRLIQATGTLAGLLRDQAITSTMVSPAGPGELTPIAQIAPNYTIRFEATMTVNGEQISTYRYVTTLTVMPETMGDVLDMVNTTIDLITTVHGVSLAFTGNANVFIS